MSDSKEQKDSRPLLMIPGPTEFHQDVLKVLSEPSPSHVSPSFIEEFGAAIQLTRAVLKTRDGQPFVLSGSGTLGWEFILVNLLQAGDAVLVVNTGYFSDSFAACCAAFKLRVVQVRCPKPGAIADIKEVAAALEGNDIRMVCLTQVDTSTGVKNDIKSLSTVVRQIKPNALIAVDGVCSFGAEDFEFDGWSIDAAMTASQKAFGVPPGLLVAAFSQRALRISSDRKDPLPAYYTAISNWLPIMRKYESREASYFATPAVNLIRALHVSLKYITSIGMETVVARHTKSNNAFKAALRALNLTLVPTSEEVAASTLSAIRYPAGVGPDLLNRLKAEGIVAAGGLHKDIKSEYFRIGHMGVSVLNSELGHIRRVVVALERALRASGYTFNDGAGVEAFDRVMRS